MNKTLLVFAIIFLAAVVFSHSQQTAPTPAPVVPTPAPAPTPPPPPAPQVPAPKSYGEARQLALLGGDRIFLYFGASWCGPCKQMKATTLADPGVKNQLSKFIVWTVDIDQDRALSQRFHVSGVPCYMVIDGLETVEKQATGYRDSAAFLGWLNSK